eukprot:g5150.t1
MNRIPKQFLVRNRSNAFTFTSLLYGNLTLQNSTLISNRNSATEAVLPTDAENSDFSSYEKSSRELLQEFHSSTQFRQIVASRFHNEPKKAVKELLDELRNEHKKQLLLALHSTRTSAGARTGTSRDWELANEIFNAMDHRSPHGLLDRGEFVEALKVHRRHEKKEKSLRGRAALTNSELVSLGLTTSIPYIGFGFLDNFIMIMAGESIEGAFGVTLGLSMMAAAALGNTVSDVAGVIVQNSVEQQQQSKRFNILNPPLLSKYQRNTFSVQVTKILAAIIGVCIGCLLGMIPLLWFDDYGKKDENHCQKSKVGFE